MRTLWGREPAAILGAVGALISLAMAFGLELSEEQVGAVMAAVSFLLGLITRSRVTPVDQ